MSRRSTRRSNRTFSRHRGSAFAGSPSERALQPGSRSRAPGTTWLLSADPTMLLPPSRRWSRCASVDPRICEFPVHTRSSRLLPRLPLVDGREAAQRWADVWERGWREHDAEAIAALYADGAFWQQHPFREPEPGYLDRVFAEEESAACDFGTPIVDGDEAAIRGRRRPSSSTAAPRISPVSRCCASTRTDSS